MLLTCMHAFNNTHTPLQPEDVCELVYPCPPPSSQNRLFLYPVNHQPPWLLLKLHYRPPVHSRTEHVSNKSLLSMEIRSRGQRGCERIHTTHTVFPSALLFYSLSPTFSLRSPSLFPLSLSLPALSFFLSSLSPTHNLRKISLQIS